MANIRSFKELRVWQNAMDLAMRIFEITKGFPPEEKYSLTDQFRRASRSIAANISEAWRKRRYPAAFISKLSDSESEAAETETWTEFPGVAAISTMKSQVNLIDAAKRFSVNWFT